MARDMHYDDRQGTIPGIDLSHRGLMQVLRERSFHLKQDNRLDSFVPLGYTADFHDHDTGTHLKVYAVADGVPSLLVWYGTWWVHSGYESNEDKNIIGFQPDCAFAEADVTSLLTAIVQFDADKKAQKAAEEADFLSRQEAARAQSIEFFKKRTLASTKAE